MKKRAADRIVSFFSRRGWIIILLYIVTPLGFWCKGYSGAGHTWFNDYGGGVLYEIFWCLLVFFFVPSRKNALRIAVGVLVVTSILETMQLWRPEFLERIRETYLGAAMLGTTFVWWDFPHYVLGCLIGFILMRMISKPE